MRVQRANRRDGTSELMARPAVTVVGLGPGGHEHVTVETVRAIARIPHRFLRTGQHPSADLVPDAVTFDDHYEAADRFDDVYAAIVEELVAAAAEHGEVLYAVPARHSCSSAPSGRCSPTIASTAPCCRRCPSSTSPGPASASTRWRPACASSTVTSSPPPPPGQRARCSSPTPMPTGCCRTSSSPSRTPLATSPWSSCAASEHRTSRSPTTWSELDRAVEADHLTCVYVPRSASPSVPATSASTSSPARCAACPWDREQTHASLVPYLVEETFELVDALAALDPDDPATEDAVIEELGDVLYQIEFHATIAEQAGRFSIADVTAGIHDKLVRRHPHVFGDVAADDAAAVLANWEQLKRAEKGRTSVFDGVAHSLPALAYTQHLARKAAKVGFDWPDVDGPLAKVDEELAELREAIASGDPARIADELGDLVVAAVNVARPAHVDAELATRAAAGSSGAGSKRSRPSRASAASTYAPPTWRRSTRSGTRSRRPLSRGKTAGHAVAVRRSGGPPPPRDAAVRDRSRRPGTCRTCTGCSACTATSCGWSSSAPPGSGRRTS